jgi:hypothetical protein
MAPDTKPMALDFPSSKLILAAVMLINPGGKIPTNAAK